MTLTTLIAKLEEALKAATPGPWGTAGRTMVCSLNDAPYPELLADASQCINDEANARLIALMRNSLPTLIEAVKRQGEAKDTPIWGVWVDYNLAPPGSYACLVSSFVNGQWSDPEARWMPAQGRPALQGQIRIMPHLMPNDPLTAHKEKSDV